MSEALGGRTGITVLACLVIVFLIVVVGRQAFVEETRPYEAVLLSPVDGSVVAVVSPVYPCEGTAFGFVDATGKRLYVGGAWVVRPLEGKRFE